MTGKKWAVHPPPPMKADWHVHEDRAEGVRGPLIAVTADLEDARLIAAAPEMLEALKAVAQNYCPEYRKAFGDQFPFTAVRDAIAKAEVS